MTLRVALVITLACTALACSRDPETAAREYISSGDSYVAERKFNEAVIEYRNAVQRKPELAEAHYKLAKAYMEAGEPAKAYSAFTRAADLDPSNVDAHIQAGTLLIVTGEYDLARTRAELAVKAAPNHPKAHILLGNALAGLNETGRAARQIEQAIALDPASAPSWSALGAVQLVAGRRAEAGEAFRKAVDLAPRSMDSRLALANYQWATGDAAQAEQTLREALTLEGDPSAVHRTLAVLYVVTGRAPEAEPHFKALVNEPGGRVSLADYYVSVGKRDAALEVLRPVASDGDAADARSAAVRIASLDYAAGRKDEAHRRLDEILRDKPRHEEARIAKARLLLEDGNAEEAAMHAAEAVKVNGSSAPAHYTAGLAALARRDLDAAERAFDEVVRLNPRASAARLQLAKLQLARGEAAGAFTAAEEVARTRPDDVQAAIVMARSLRAKGDLTRAQREVETRLARQPNAPGLRAELGWVALERRDVGLARASFEEAARLAPDLHDARVGLVMADVAAGKPEDARARVDRWLQQAPSDVRLRLLSARVSLATNDAAGAERVLREVIAADAAQLDAYEMLGRLYMAQGHADRALNEFKALASRAPQPAGALTMAGMIHEARNDRAAARAEYERALASDPKAGVAANNLAWIYAEEGRLDDALRLATVAKEILRQRPEAEDTLGWVYLKKGLHQQAMAAFERALARAPGNATYKKHLAEARAAAR